MKPIRGPALIGLFIVILIFSGCTFQKHKPAHFEEIPSMLNILTNKAQSAVEEGVYHDGGEKAVFEYINNTNPNYIEWFISHNFELRIGVIEDTAIVLVCNQGNALFEDTYCNPGLPDKDHSNSASQPCNITMSEREVREVCK